MSALGYYVPGERDQHRHPVLCRSWKDTSGSFRAAATCRWESAGRANRRRRCARGWNAIWKSRGFRKRARPFTAICCPVWKRRVEAEPRGGRRMDGGGRCRGPGGSDHGRRYLLRAASADLAAQAMLSERRRPAAAIAKLLRRDFMGDLEFGSRLAHRVFHGVFCGDR